MLRSMYAGISGMKANQTKLDVIGNNVANVGTTSFKGSRVRFQDMLSQNVKFGSGPSRVTGGVNPSQVGLGVQIGGIDRLMHQGHMQPTGRNLDIAMDGEGYFMVSSGPIPNSNAQGVQVNKSEYTISGGKDTSISYTRDGSLALDTQGYLVTSTGLRVLGYPVSPVGEEDLVSINYANGGLCEFVDADSKDGLVAQNNLVPLRIPDTVYVRASKLNGSEDMTMIGKSDAITTKPKVTITNNETNTYNGEEDLNIEVRVIQKDEKYTKPGETTESNIVAGEWGVYINGELVGQAGENVEYKDEDGTVIRTVSVTKPDTDEDLSTEEGRKKLKDITFTENVYAEGDKKVRTFSIEQDGIIKGILEDGKVAILGQVAVAGFQNPEGLTSLGQNNFTTSPNSGTPTVRSGIGADERYDNSDAYGAMLNGMLEMSNVDLAEQFTEMIVTSRAFQASSKMISTGDEILQELINLKR